MTDRQARRRPGPWVTPTALSALAAVLVLLDRPLAAFVPVVLVLILLQARWVAPEGAARAEAAVGRVAGIIGHAVGGALSWALLTLVFVLLFLPISLVALLFSRRPTIGSWTPRATPVSRRTRSRTFGLDPRPVARSNLLVRALAVVAALVLLDLAAGAALQGTGLLRQPDRGDVERAVRQSIRTTMSAPALDGDAWAQDFGQAMLDFELGNTTYVPFLVRGIYEFHSPYLNTTDTERVSYEPPAAGGGERLRVAFFGGSVAFGVGQRDEHTIPSEFARVAEAAGVPVEVHNYGFPAYVSWQEVQRFEHLLAAGERYDLAVFYDGFNDMHIQEQTYSPDPVHSGVYVLQGFLDDYHERHEEDRGWAGSVQELAAAYGRTSAVARIADRLFGEEHVVVPPTSPASSDEEVDAALDIYGRSVRIATDLGRDVGVPVRFVWQPAVGEWPADVTDRLPDEVIDLSGLFVGREDRFYIDEVHTNEEGAHLAAEALWRELGPELDAMAATRG